MDGRGAKGYFAKSNKFATGRPPGALNKVRTPSFLEDDLRLAPARRFRGLMARMANDLGGPDGLSVAQKQLIRRCAMISVECERLEKAALESGALDAPLYGVLTGYLTRTLSLLGIKREPRDITPSLADYLEARNAQNEAALEPSEDA
jgi:hypothetical protein